jgi:polyhydroxybutyrate depolymerase
MSSLAGAGGSAAGSAGSGGSSAGAGGGGGTSAGGAAAAMPTEGCGKAAPAEFTPEMYVRKSLPDVKKTPKGAERVYELRLPKDYKSDHPYPIVFESHGCDGSIPFHIEKATGTAAIVIALRAASNQDSNYTGGCFATGPNDAELTELPYFDAVVATVSANLCVDKSRLFMEGYSSGSWLTNLLGCTRAGVLRGQGNATGGLPTVPAMCAGPIAAMLVHDDTDDQNKIEEGIKARDRIKAINGCSNDTPQPYVWDTNPATPSTCVAYQGCQPGFPLIWCPTHGKGHSDQVPITTTGLWKFWSSLP